MAIKSVLGGDYALGDRTDEQLVELARSGGSRTGAWDELYRRHAGSARSLARHLLRDRHDADDVVNEAFAGVISAIGHGAGPRDNFRQYLMACVRNGCKKRAWKGSASVSTDPAILEARHGAVFEDAEQFGEAGLVASAFSSLSPDWQRALWLTAVEERPTEEIARELGRRPAAVAALAHRAREAFAEAYLSQHQKRVTSPACERITPKLAHYVRGRSGDIDTARIEHHLATCADCTHAVGELRDVNSSLRTLALPTTLAGAGVAAATMAPVLALGTASSFGGWAAGVLGGITFAKAALIAALLVPAVAIATEAATDDKRTIAAAEAVDESTPVPTTAPAREEDDGGADADGAPDPRGEAVTAAVSATESTTASTSPAATADAGLDAEAPLAAPVLDGQPDPGISITTLAVPSVLPSAGPVGAAPIVSVPRAPTVTLPGGVSTPAVSLPPISVLPSVVVPSISTPPIVVVPSVSTPQVVVPSISTPLVTTPQVVVPPVSVPPVAVPSISLPPVSVPAVVVPSISLPPVGVPLSIPEVVLPSLPLPLPKLPDLLGN